MGRRGDGIDTKEEYKPANEKNRFFYWRIYFIRESLRIYFNAKSYQISWILW